MRRLGVLSRYHNPNSKMSARNISCALNVCAIISRRRRKLRRIGLAGRARIAGEKGAMPVKPGLGITLG